MKESEDNLENFFRNRAEGNQYNFKEDDWAKMEAKLDEKMPVIAPYPFSKYAWMGLGTLITAVFFISYTQLLDTDNFSNEQTEILNDSVKYASSMLEIKPLSNKLSTIENYKVEASKELIDINKKSNATGVIQKKYSKKAPIEQQNQVTLRVKPFQLYSQPKPKANQNIDALNAKTIRVVAGTSKKESIIGAEPIAIAFLFADFYEEPVKIVGLEQKPIALTLKRLYTLSLLGSTDITSTDASEWGKPTFRFGIAGEYYIGKQKKITGINTNRTILIW